MSGVSRLLPAFTAIVALAGWWLLAARYPPGLLPSPLEVLAAGWEGRADLLKASGVTAYTALAGLALATAAGVSGAVLFQRSAWLERALYPYALLVQTVPIVAIAPLLVIWLGYGTPPAIASAAIVAFFPVLTAANLGLAAAPEEQLELFALYGARWGQTLRMLRLPGALPFLFGGLRAAAGLSVIGAIVGEFVGSNGIPLSLGHLMLRSLRRTDTPIIFAAIGCATVLALLFFGTVRLAERRVIGPWHGGGRT